MTNRWARVEEVFHAARILPHEEREQFLAEVCGDAPELAAEVRSLLQHTRGLNGFLERPAGHRMAPIASGTRLGGYDIKSFVGSGGMGDVYLASDVQLHRDVAIKVLPDLFSQDPARLLRFEREARLLAQVNHPAVAAIYGCEHADDHHFLVLEYVPGDTLAELISTGPVPLDRALAIAIQIASAVQAAHDRGIVHRDLKPANIKITPNGTIKVLDFGLARSTNQTHARASEEASGPRDQTASGAILGTAAYMSPEQARGQVVDARTDIWAFGCILFELITGTRPFAGATTSDTLVNVLTGMPDWDRVPAAAPPLVRTVLRRCLQKDPADRFHSIADARFLLEDTARPGAERRWAGRRLARVRGLWLAVAGAAVLIAAATVTASFWRGRTPVAVEGLRFVIPVTTGHLRGNEAMAISPDGTTLVFAVQEGNPLVSQLYRRAANEFEATAIPGTRTGSRPFFSPDGQWVAYFSDTELRKVSFAGGPPVVVCSVGVQWGGAWGADQSIVFGSDRGLWRVPASGGPPTLIAADPENPDTSYRWPQVLADGSVLFTIFKKALQFDVAIRTPAGQIRTLVRDGTKPRFLPPGQLLFARESTLMVVPFDPDRHTVLGEPRLALAGVRTDGNNGSAAFVVSPDGTLAYNPGELVTIVNKRLVKTDREGREQALPFPPQPYVTARVSPDNRRIAAVIDEQIGNRLDRSIWIGDLARETLTRLTFEGNVTGDLTWTPDGDRVTYRRSGGKLYWRKIDLTGPEEEVAPGVAVPASESAGTWSPNGKTLIFSGPSAGQASQDLWTLTRSETGEFRLALFLQTPADEVCPVFSPDGRWVSYIGHDSGRQEIYVRPFSGPGPVVQVSKEGGASPHWLGGELLYFQPSPAKIMAATVSATGVFHAIAPRSVHDVPGGYAYATASSDHRFLIFARPAGPTPRVSSGIYVVTDWGREVAGRTTPRR